jgi:HEAT repeat protein
MTSKRDHQKTWMSAEELMGELEADPEFQARREERERDRQRKAFEFRRAEAPLTEDLRRLGLHVHSAWDLVNSEAPYPEAIPILIEHLEHPYPDRVREGMARALGVPDARPWWKSLIDLYQREPQGTNAKDGLAVALAAVSDDAVVDDVIRLAEDTGHGASRVLLLSALHRSQEAHARRALEGLRGDPDLRKEVTRILRHTG